MISLHRDGSLVITLLGGKHINLTKDELRELIITAHTQGYCQETIRKLSEGARLSISGDHGNIRPYNNRDKILKLFNLYSSENSSKAEIFRKISKELNISYKAVEKAYYKK